MAMTVKITSLNPGIAGGPTRHTSHQPPVSSPDYSGRAVDDCAHNAHWIHTNIKPVRLATRFTKFDPNDGMSSESWLKLADVTSVPIEGLPVIWQS
jgi:hypothetical protein